MYNSSFTRFDILDILYCNAGGERYEELMEKVTGSVDPPSAIAQRLSRCLNYLSQRGYIDIPEESDLNPWISITADGEEIYKDWAHQKIEKRREQKKSLFFNIVSIIIAGAALAMSIISFIIR